MNNEQNSNQNNNQIVHLIFENMPVRMIVDEFGEPWLVAKDVCDILDHSNHRMALQGLDDDEKGVRRVYTQGGEQEMIVINEPGLYSLIHSSRKQQAKVFKRWVNHEVLPSIRKTGSYAMPGASASSAAELQAIKALSTVVGQLTWAIERIERGEVARMINRGFATMAGRQARVNYDLEQILNFVYGECEIGDNELVAKRDLHATYRQYCAEIRQKPYGYNAFFQALSQSRVKTANEFLRLPHLRRPVPVIRGLSVKEKDYVEVQP